MSLDSEVNSAVDDMAKAWATTNWSSTTTDVPDPDKLGYSDGKWVNATYLYSDIIDSSGLVARAKDPEVVASVMSTFLKVSVRIIRSQDGHIRSFDGDRVMGIFTGPAKETRAVIAAMKISRAVNELVNPKIVALYPNLRGWTLREMTGLASTKALLVRAGIRNNSDLLSVGVGPNLAAKLSDLRTTGSRRIAIGKGTYDSLEQRAIMSGDKNMWHGPFSIPMGGGNYNYLTTSYQWGVL